MSKKYFNFVMIRNFVFCLISCIMFRGNYKYITTMFLILMVIPLFIELWYFTTKKNIIISKDDITKIIILFCTLFTIYTLIYYWLNKYSELQMSSFIDYAFFITTNTIICNIYSKMCGQEVSYDK